MFKEFDLYKATFIVTIICLAIATIGLLDFSGVSEVGEMTESLKKPLELKNWHYALLIWVIFIGGNKTN